MIIAPDRTQRPRGEPDRPRRGVIILPNGFTLASLFFGIFAIVAASRSEFDTAGLYVVFGGLCDALDGRVARATGTGSRFGSELDSLVDAITFGLAPAMIMYFAVLNRNGWDWMFSRSEEHTSELQSLRHLVCRLLLEKKKNIGKTLKLK